MKKIFFGGLFFAATILPISALADSMPAANTTAATSIISNSATLNANITPNGPATNAWFEYGIVQPLSQTTVSQNAGGGFNQLNFSFAVANLQANTTYYFRVVAQNQYGTVYGNTISFFTGSQGGTNAPVVLNQITSNVAANSASLTGTVQPNGSPTSVWFDYGTTTSFGQQSTVQNIGNSMNSVDVYATLSGLQANTTYYFRTVAQNQYGTAYGNVVNFFTSNSGGATAVPTILNFYSNSSSGTITASIDPHGQNVDAWVEYGTTAYLGQNTATQTFQNSYSITAQFIFNLTNLNSGTTYYYRVVARNSYGTIYGNIANFVASSQYQPAPAPAPIYGASAPAATTQAATEVNETSARLNSSVNPNSAETTAWFEFGRDYTLRGSGGNRSLGSAAGTNAFAIILMGLKPGTAYYYRVVAKNSFGTRTGEIFSFRTAGLPISTSVVVADDVSRNAASSSDDTAAQPVNSAEPETMDNIFSLKTDNDTPVAGGEIGVFTAYRNPLNSEIRQIKITATLPPGVEFISSSPEASSHNANIYVFDLGNAAAGAAGTAEIRAKIQKNAGKSLNFSASIQYRDINGTSYAIAADEQVELVRVKTAMDYKSLSASISNVFGNVPGYVWFFVILLLVALGGAAVANTSK